MALTKEQIRIMDGITGLNNSETFASPKNNNTKNATLNNQNSNISTLSDEDIKRMDAITGLAQYELPKQEPTLREQIIQDDPVMAKELEDKGAITPYEAALDASREFNGTYDKVIQRENLNAKNPAELNAMGKAVSKFLDDRLPIIKKAIKKIDDVLPKFDAEAAIRTAENQAELNKHSQGVNENDKTKRYEIASVSRTGTPIYREIDLLDKIGFLEAMRENTIKGTALGALAEGLGDKKYREIKNKILKGEEIYQDELDFINRQDAKEREKVIRGYSIGGKVGSAVGLSLGLAADILTGSYVGELFGLGRAATGVATNAYKGLRGVNAGKNLSRVGANVASWGTRSLGGAGITTVVNAPYRLTAEYQGRMLNNEVELTDTGNFIFKESDEKPATAFFKSLEKLYIMYFTEMGGGEALGALAKGLGKGVEYVASPVVENLFKKFPTLEPLITKTTSAFAKKYEELHNLPILGKSTDWLKNKAHFDGFLEECGEEALEDVLNLVVGTENEDRSLENFAKAVFKTPEEWAVISGSILIQGAGLSAANYIIANNMAKKGKTPEEIQNTINNISQSQASDIIDELIKNNEINVGDDVRLTDADKRRSIEIKENIKQKLLDVNVSEQEANDLSILTGAMYERYATRSDESREVFNEYINNLQVKYNVPIEDVLKGGVQFNQNTNAQFQNIFEDIYNITHDIFLKGDSEKVSDLFDYKEELTPLKEYFSDVLSNMRFRKMPEWMKENELQLGGHLHLLNTNTIYLNYEKIGSYENKEQQFYRTLLHEMMHAKQYKLIDYAQKNLNNKSLSKEDKQALKKFLQLNRKSVEAVKQFKDFNKKHKLNELKNNKKLAKKYKEIHNKYANAYMEADADNVALALLAKIGKTNNAILRNYLSDIESIDAQYDADIQTKELSQIHSFIDRVHKNRNANVPQRLSDRINTKTWFQPAYHGTPHKFDEFSTDFIGNGEGAQAHGWGLYFAENKDVSEGYRQKLLLNGSFNTKYDIKINGKPADAEIRRYILNNFSTRAINNIMENPASFNEEIKDYVEAIKLDIERSDKWLQVWRDAVDYIEKNPKISVSKFSNEIKNEEKYRFKYIIQDAKNKAKSEGRKTTAKDIQTATKEFLKPHEERIEKEREQLKKLSEINNLEIKQSEGQLYEVDIPENEVLLDEDKKFSKQSQEVQDAIIKLYEDNWEKYQDKNATSKLAEIIYTDNTSKKYENNLSYKEGRSIYQYISDMVGSDKEASELLNKYGIKGITYDGLRDGRCYVVFDDKAVKILETYYQEIEPEEENLIAGYTYQEVADKLTELWGLQEEVTNENKDTQDELMAKIHILEDAFEASVHPEKYQAEQKTDIMLNAYYVMNDEKIPQEYIESDKKSARSYNDYVKLHKERKEEAEKKYRGYFSKEAELKPIVVIMKEKNASTALHEFSHMFLDLLNEMARVNPDARVQLEAVNKWLNYTGEYTAAQHEKFANNFVAYLYKGKAPNSKLKTVFENFKEWLKSVYKSVFTIPNFELSEEVEELFDNIFGTDSFFEESKAASELLKKVKNNVKKQKLEDIKFSDDENELDETQKRHKKVSYEILAAATGKNEKYLKTIFEGNAKGSAKKREAIQKLIDETEDKIYISGGMREEWKEFYADTGVDYDTDEVGGGYKLASAAFETIINKNYRSNDDFMSELDERAQYYENAIDEADRQYKLLLREYKKGNKNVALAAICEWIDGLDNQIKKDYEDRFIYDSSMLDRESNVDKFEKAKRAIIKRALEVENQYRINKDEQYREVVKEIMKNLNFLNPSDKARLTANILDIGSSGMLMGRINQILDVAKTMEDISYRRRLELEIHNELQGTKNVKKSGKQVGKYDYRTNKLFEELRQLDKLSPEKANELRLENKRFIDADERVLNYREKLINKFLSYKAGGRTFEDTDLMKELYDEIVKIKLAGKSAKSELELEEKLNNEKDIEELFNVLGKKKAAKWTTKLYNECFGNIESTINLIFNKKIKEKYATEILYAGTNASTWSYEQKQKVIEGIASVYNVPKWRWDSVPIKYLSEKFTFNEIRRKYNEDGEIIKTRIIPREMTKMDILNAYIQSQNEVGRSRLINQFGEDTLDSMFDELSLQDVKLAELLMHSVQANYGLVNKAYIKRYGIDLPRVSNYFPFTPERMDDVNNYNEYQAQSYSFIKSRSGSEILPMDFHNPLDIVFSHIENVSKFIYMSESIDRANKLFKNPDIKRAIISKYGNGGYRTLEQELLNIGNRKQAEIYNGFQKVIDRITSNWLLANVMVKPLVGLKQLLSANNYAIDMPFMTWQKGFIKGIANYKETIDYMMKIPYLKARYGSGFSNEALKQEIESSKYATVQSLKNFLTLNIRLGDIGAIIFGGKPYIDYLIKERGMSEDEAIKQFVLSTNRSQQSSEVSSLSNFQINMARSPLLRIMTSYRNAQQQYVRMCGDAVVSVANGDMTKEQCAKVLFNYGFFQPFLFAVATSGSLLRGLLTGDWDDLLDDIKLSLFNLGSDSVAFFGDVYKYVVQRLIATNKFTRRGYDTPLFGEMMDEINRVSKEDVELSDWLHLIGFAGGKLGIGIDVNQNIGNSIIGATSDITQGDIIQGGLRAIGMTEKRAKRITGND